MSQGKLSEAERRSLYTNACPIKYFITFPEKVYGELVVSTPFRYRYNTYSSRDRSVMLSYFAPRHAYGGLCYPSYQCRELFCQVQGVLPLLSKVLTAKRMPFTSNLIAYYYGVWSMDCGLCMRLL
eukprot:scaffold746_cov96-Skeletonema_dohrnii-CCMP3373.AAC.3